MVPILSRGSCLRDNKEDNEKKRKQDEKRLEIQRMIHNRSYLFVNIWTQTCLNLDLYKLDLLK